MIWLVYARSWRQGTRFHRAARVLNELCLMVWPMRRDPRYINTVGRWWLELRQR